MWCRSLSQLSQCLPTSASQVQCKCRHQCNTLSGRNTVPGDKCHFRYHKDNYTMRWKRITPSSSQTCKLAASGIDVCMSLPSATVSAFYGSSPAYHLNCAHLQVQLSLHLSQRLDIHFQILLWIAYYIENNDAKYNTNTMLKKSQRTTATWPIMLPYLTVG